MSIAAGPIAGAPIAAAEEIIQPDVVVADLRISVIEVRDAPAAALRISVYETGAAAADLTISVLAVADVAVAPLRIAVYETGTAAADLTIAVVPLDAHAPGGRWRPVVTIGGVDESVRITGTLTVEAEEGAARIADVLLRPGTGTINLATWVGKTVTIDYARRAADGAPLYPQRLFTGLVDLPEYDPVRRLTRLRCTDDLQGLVAGLPRATLDAVIGGYWSAAVFEDQAADGWRYAQDRVSTVPASLDCDPWRALRLTSWEAAASAYLEYAEGAILDGSLGVRYAERSAVRNRIDIDFRYRVTLLKKRVIGIGYTYPFQLSQIMVHGYTIPTRQMIGDAIRSAGWEISGAIGYVPCPAGPLTVNLGSGETGIWALTADVAQELCFGFSASLKKRYTQQVEERYACTVRNALSIGAMGELAESRSGALAQAFDTAGWEGYREPQLTEGSMYETTGTHEPVPALPDIAQGEVALECPGTAADDRAAAQAALQTLIAQAQAAIWQSHRGNAVSFAVPLDGRIDLNRTLRVATAAVAAKGKVRKVRHVMDCDSGRAVSEVDLALCAAVGLGLPHGHSTPAAPVAPVQTPAGPAEPTHTVGAYVGQAWYSGPLRNDMFGYFTNVQPGSPDYSPDAPTYPVQFSVRLPEIEAASRDNRTESIASTYEARIVEDEFAVTA